DEGHGDEEVAHDGAGVQAGEHRDPPEDHLAGGEGQDTPGQGHQVTTAAGPAPHPDQGRDGSGHDDGAEHPVAVLDVLVVGGGLDHHGGVGPGDAVGPGRAAQPAAGQPDDAPGDHDEHLEDQVGHEGAAQPGGTGAGWGGGGGGHGAHGRSGPDQSDQRRYRAARPPSATDHPTRTSASRAGTAPPPRAALRPSPRAADGSQETTPATASGSWLVGRTTPPTPRSRTQPRLARASTPSARRVPPSSAAREANAATPRTPTTRAGRTPTGSGRHPRARPRPPSTTAWTARTTRTDRAFPASSPPRPSGVVPRSRSTPCRRSKASRMA